MRDRRKWLGLESWYQERIWFALAFIVGTLAYILTPAYGPVHAVANGLFYGGMVLFLIGCGRVARGYGLGDLFAYSFGRMSYVLRRQKQDEVPAPFPPTYFDYQEERRERRERERPGKGAGPLVLGLGLVALSYLVSLLV